MIIEEQIFEVGRKALASMKPGFMKTKSPTFLFCGEHPAPTVNAVILFEWNKMTNKLYWVRDDEKVNIPL